MFEGLHDQFSTFYPEKKRPNWSVTAVCFSKEKETPLKLEERLGYMQAAFLKLGVDMFFFGQGQLVDRRKVDLIQ